MMMMMQNKNLFEDSSGPIARSDRSDEPSTTLFSSHTQHEISLLSSIFLLQNNRSLGLHGLL